MCKGSATTFWLQNKTKGKLALKWGTRPYLIIFVIVILPRLIVLILSVYEFRSWHMKRERIKHGNFKEHKFVIYKC